MVVAYLKTRAETDVEKIVGVGAAFVPFPFAAHEHAFVQVPFGACAHVVIGVVRLDGCLDSGGAYVVKARTQPRTAIASTRLAILTIRLTRNFILHLAV